MNQLQLLASLVTLGQQRYTPAGLPAIEAQLQYTGELEQLGQKRSVKLLLDALAFGHLAETLSQAPLGSVGQFTGFLCNKSARQISTKVVFHIQEFQFIEQGESHARIQKI